MGRWGRRLPILMVLLIASTIGAALLSCPGSSGLQRRTGPEYALEVQSWKDAVRQLGGNGMWLVSRGYHAGDDVVAMATASALSHVAVLDLERDQVIEAVGKGVTTTPIDTYLDETHRLLIVKPHGWTPDRGYAALEKARSKVGQGYDFLGVVGLPSRDRYYCTELAAWSFGIAVDGKGPQQVLLPVEMKRFGTVLLDTQERDTRPDTAARSPVQR